MSLSLKEVEHIAELAKLALTDEEKARFRDQLDAILDYAARLQKIDTDEIPPTASVLPVDSVMRDDEVKPSAPAAEILRNTAKQEAEMFQVREVME